MRVVQEKEQSFIRLSEEVCVNVSRDREQPAAPVRAGRTHPAGRTSATSEFFQSHPWEIRSHSRALHTHTHTHTHPREKVVCFVSRYDLLPPHEIPPITGHLFVYSPPPHPTPCNWPSSYPVQRRCGMFCETCYCVCVGHWNVLLNIKLWNRVKWEQREVFIKVFHTHMKKKPRIYT